MGSQNRGTRGSWARLAAVMGSQPEMAILRKFRRLNVLRLLEMQSHLTNLEMKYDIISQQDCESDCPLTRLYSKDWDALNKSQGDGAADQRDAWREIRGSLAAYSKSMKSH